MTEFLKIADPCQLSQVLGDPVLKAATAASIVLDPAVSPATEAGPLNIALVDCYQLSQECLAKAFEELQPRPMVSVFETVQASVSGVHKEFDLIVYYTHSNDLSEKLIVRDVQAFRQVFKTAPVIILSDAEDAQHPKTIRSALRNGVQGFIPTRTTGLPITFAAIRFIAAGGVFAPVDLLLTNRSDHAVEAARQSRLTARQMGVLVHLQQGKANKIIAHELGMSESTVKVHVRNIMRKIGATNRTQAAYKAQKLWGNGAMSNMLDGGTY